jgi:uncharacterized protein YdeI (YjbR/CyaY-like superfamily)
LKEEMKWYQPCYTYNDQNVCIIGGFKSYFSLGFFKGSLMSDPDQVLEKPGKNTESSEIIKFYNTDDISSKKELILAYIREAIQIEKDGLKVNYSQPKQQDFPDELIQIFKNNPDLEKAFKNLTPGRQKGYLLFFNAAKQSQTKTARIEKYMDKIMDGKGLNDY